MSDAADSSSTPKVTPNEKNLVVSFIQFLRQKVSSNQCTDDQIEGLEVAVQCLEAAFGLTDKNYAFQPSRPLIEIFKAAEGLPNNVGDEEFPEPTQAEIEQANRFKEEGNEFVKAGKFDEGIVKYNEAIKLNRDPIYFCNRAAAYCRLEQYDLAIQDCRTALALDPKYAKAYGRMGLVLLSVLAKYKKAFSVALTCQNRYEQAVEAYKKALEIDPDNAQYKQNLQIAEDKLKEAQQAFQQGAPGGPGANPFAAMAGMGGLGGLGGLGDLLNNPQMMQMASQMMTDPNVQNMMSQMMGAFMGPGGAAGGPGGAGGPPPLNDLLRAGEA
ncbi:TPR Domain containing protein, partial [Aphelenchoides avenae]